MQLNQGNVFVKSTVIIDAKRFEDCVFQECTLLYNGGEAPAFKGCKFTNSRLMVGEAAARTCAFLQAMFNSTLRPMAEPILNEIQKPAPPAQPTT